MLRFPNGRKGYWSCYKHCREVRFSEAVKDAIGRCQAQFGIVWKKEGILTEKTESTNGGGYEKSMLF